MLIGTREGAVFALLPAFVSALGSVVVDQETNLYISSGQQWRIRLGLNVGAAQGAGCTILGKLQTLG